MSIVESRRPLHQRDLRFVEMVRVMSGRLPAAAAGRHRDTPHADRTIAPARRVPRPGSRKK